MADLAEQVARQLKNQRSQIQNAKELSEWRKEQEEHKSNELKNRLAKFLIERRHENDIITLIVN